MTAGFGASAFGVFPCGSAPTATTATTPDVLTSSRSITVDGQYEVSDEGGFAGMNDVDQCVRNLVFLAVHEAGGSARFATDQDASKIRLRVADRLRPLADPKDPKIRILTNTVTANDPTGRMSVFVKYRNLTSSTTQTAKAAL